MRNGVDGWDVRMKTCYVYFTLHAYMCVCASRSG